MKQIIFVAITLVALFSLTVALKCAPNACELVDCRPVCPCQPGYVLQKGGHCLCCDVCKKVIGLGEYCGSDSPIGGVISDKVVCNEEENLICMNDRCVEAE